MLGCLATEEAHEWRWSPELEDGGLPQLAGKGALAWTQDGLAEVADEGLEERGNPGRAGAETKDQGQLRGMDPVRAGAAGVCSGTAPSADDRGVGGSCGGAVGPVVAA